MIRLSIVVPVLDEAGGIVASLDALQPYRRWGHEVIVVDGGSRDDTVALATPRCDRLVVASRGRASQMNVGAQVASGDVLVFLHADTRLPDRADALIEEGLSVPGAIWGRFDVRIEGASRWFPVIAALMNLRSRWTGMATGDQAIFVKRAVFDAMGGYADIALMEDLALSRALRRRAPPVCLRDRVLTSGRRWERHGVVRTILLMWRLRLAWWLGANPERLARRYVRDDA